MDSLRQCRRSSPYALHQWLAKGTPLADADDVCVDERHAGRSAPRPQAVAQARIAFREGKSATFLSSGSSVYWWMRQAASIRGAAALP